MHLPNFFVHPVGRQQSAGGGGVSNNFVCGIMRMGIDRTINVRAVSLGFGLRLYQQDAAVADRLGLGLQKAIIRAVRLRLGLGPRQQDAASEALWHDVHFRWYDAVVQLLGFREGALRVKISRGAPLEVQNGTQQDLNEMIDLFNFLGQKDCLHAENGCFELGPNKIWIKC